MWLVIFAFAAVVSALCLAQVAVLGWLPSVPAATNLAEVGAAYGAAAAFISGFAFVAVVASMVGQKRQLLRQQEDLTAQRAELEEQKRLLVAQTEALTTTSHAQRGAAVSLQGQLTLMSRRARLDDYDRRLERLAGAQADLDDETLRESPEADISHDEARARLGRRYLSALTNLLRELERLRDDPALGARAVEELREELKTSLERERALLYLAVVPTRAPGRYKLTELGRLMADFKLFPYIELEGARGRAAVYLKHFWPRVRDGAQL